MHIKSLYNLIQIVMNHKTALMYIVSVRQTSYFRTSYNSQNGEKSA